MHSFLFFFKLVPMNGKNTSDIVIPSISVGDNTGQVLKDYYDYQNG